MKSISKPVLLAILCASADLYAWKALSHYISLPLIEGAGIYSSVKTIADADRTVTKAVAGTNIGLLALNATIGTVTVFSQGDSHDRLRKIHRVVGFALTAAAAGLSIAASVDDNMAGEAPTYVAYGYTAFTVVPIVLFLF